ncbi:MAG: ImmA/IrrE family metallo-endopeptidase [Bacteroidia bacterium]|nr:ImmA/IrrE family metallo-endopeptidase [Bacteroidia bacterium]
MFSFAPKRILIQIMVATEVQINPKMVVLARESRGVSQKELAEKLSTSPAFICKIEMDNKSLPEPTLERMSKLLKYPIEFFYQEGEAYLPMSLNYRKRDHVSAKVLMPLEASLNIYRLNIETISQKLKLPALNIPDLDLKKIGSEEQVAKQLRKSWKMPKGPVENLTELLEANGIIVIAVDFGTERVDSRTILTKDKHPIIVINKTHLADRQRFSLAYELGHLVMHSHTLPSHDRDISHEANLFAAGLLMPENELKKDFEKGVSVSLLGELKRKWKVSMISLLYRAADLGFLTDNQKKYLLSQFNQMKIRRREPIELDFQKEKPLLLRDLILKYKNAHKFTSKELAAALHLEVEEFMTKYSE